MLKPLTAILIVVLATLPGCGSSGGDDATAKSGGETPPQNDPPSSDPASETEDPAVAPGAIFPPPPDDFDATQMDKCVELMDASLAAYRDTPIMTDEVEAIMIVGGRETNMEFSLQFDGADCEMVFRDWRYVVLNEVMYVERGDIPERYLGAKLIGDLPRTIAALAIPTFLPPHFALRAADTTEFAEAIMRDLVPDHEIAGYRSIEDEGSTWDEVLLSGERGWIIARFDPETDLLASTTFIGIPTTAPGAQQVRFHMDFNTAIEPALMRPIAFEPGDRTAVGDFDALALGDQGESGVAEVKQLFGNHKSGDVMPHFELPTLSGETVSSVELQGRALVLDFWATWNTLSQQRLPLLQEFADWAKDSGMPVSVYAININERVTGEERVERVRSFWRESNFTIETLIDQYDELADEMGFPTIPATVIVVPDGRIFRFHIGMDPNMATNLQTEVIRAIQVSGGG